ncbi:MAG: hypothetical protein K1W06_08235 [Lachnospiraceae bacterium]
MSGKNEFIRKINIRLDMMDEAHAAVLWKLDEESKEKKISRNKLILQHLYEYYQQKENEEEDSLVVTREYVDRKISALKCEVLEEVLQAISGNMQEKPLQQGERHQGENTRLTEEIQETDIFSDPVIIAAAQKWG